MKKFVFLLICTISACSTSTVRLNQEQLRDDQGRSEAPFDSLAAYRKMPGQPKTQPVEPYTRKDGKRVSGYKRSTRS